MNVHMKRICMLVLGAALIGAVSGDGILAAPGTGDPPNFRATYDGTYSISFGTGAGGTNELSFAGAGVARHLGRSTVEGTSLVRPVDPLCSEVAADAVTLTAANGDQLFLVNGGTDCLEFSTGAPVIVGAGQGEVVGGTGRFADAAGELVWKVEAPITALSPSGASGTFQLTWSGTLSR